MWNFTNLGRILTQSHPGKPGWSADQIPDLSGKVFLVTGGNVGIGYETVKQLLNHNAKVYVACRNKEKTETALAKLKKETKGKEAIFLQLDLADLQSVKACADHFLNLEPKLNVLIANAGVMVPPVQQLTQQGYDLQFGTNTLGHWYLITLLLPAIQAAVTPGEPGAARIVSLGSVASEFAVKPNFDTLKEGPARLKMGTEKLYMQSKLFNIILSKEFAQRYGETGVVFTAVHPGIIDSELMRHTPGWQDWIIGFYKFPCTWGALTQLYAATSPETATANGDYFVPWARKYPPCKLAMCKETGEKLWTWLEREIKTHKL